VLLHSSSGKITITTSIMCINILVEYDCGHKSESNIRCGKRRCRSAEDHERKEIHMCRGWSIAEMDQLRRECNKSEQEARDAKNACANAEKLWKEATDHVTVLTSRLEHVRKQLIPDQALDVDLKTTYGCGHGT
jgi:hypothetical protein